MKILLKDIPTHSMEYAGIAEICEIKNNGDDIRFNNYINFNGKLRKGEDYVEISGKVSAPFSTFCHACGDETKIDFEFEISETYRRNAGDDEYELIGNEIDFDDMILENIRLNLPTRILCHDNCNGICPVCGKKIIDEDCECKLNNDVESPFNVLKKLIK